MQRDREGETMRKWIMGLAMVLAAAPAQAQTPSQNCVLRQIESLPLEVYPDHLVLPVSFGTVPEKLVFLMQNSGSGIDGALADKMEIHVTSMPPNVNITRQGQEILRIAHVRDVHLGRLTIGDMEFLVMKPGTYPSELAGDLGTQLFAKVDLELDVAGR